MVTCSGSHPIGALFIESKWTSNFVLATPNHLEHRTWQIQWTIENTLTFIFHTLHEPMTIVHLRENSPNTCFSYHGISLILSGPICSLQSQYVMFQMVGCEPEHVSPNFEYLNTSCVVECSVLLVVYGAPISWFSMDGVSVMLTKHKRKFNTLV